MQRAVFKYQPKKSKHKYEWQSVAEEMTKHFGKNCFWIFWKYPSWKIQMCFKELKEKDDREFTHLMFKLKAK